jgi:DNA-binding NtrC family response regulator
LIHNRLETLIDEMLEGRILLDEAIGEFEKLYIKKALDKNKQHLSNTAMVLGIHRNTLAKRVATYEKQDRNGQRVLKRAAR